jgi:hypothetical protein
LTLSSVRRVVAVWLLFALLVLGCGAGRASRPFRDPTFTREAALSGGVAVVGVVSRIGSPLERERWRDELAELLAESLTRREPQIATLRNQVVDSLLGTGPLAALLDRFEENPALGTEEISELAAAFDRRARYAVFAAVTEEEVREFTGWPETALPPQEGTPRMRENVTHLDLRIVGAVYDLWSQLEVWRGEVKGSAERASAAFDPNKRTPLYPPPPSLLEAVPEAFSRFADRLFE